MDGAVCVVTGANGAMGRVTAEELARRGAAVVLLCRSRERGEGARAEIERATGNPNVELAVADLSSQQDVRRAAAEIVQRHPRVHVLVNNAGAFARQREETAEGIEKIFATNYVGHFLLTHLLLDELKAGAPSRIVNIASRTGRYALDVDDLMFERRKYTMFSAASQSKLALVMFTLELARRLEGTGVTVNAVHPGLVKSSLTDGMPPALRTMLKLVSTTPEKGARTAVHLATSPDVEGVSGAFFGPKQKRLKLPAQAADEEVRRRLWDRTVALAGT